MSVIRSFFLICLLVCGSFSAFAESINVNLADATSIAKVLKGVGLQRAQAIVAYRDQNGPYSSLDDLAKVKGIGVKTLERNQDNIRFDSD